MFLKKLAAYRRCAVVPLMVAFVVAGSAQTASLVTTGLYVISSEAGNSILRLSGNGLILVDGQPPDNYDTLRERVARISKQSIRVLIVTDYHQSHTGTNARFLNDGTAILLQENAQQRLATYHPPSGQTATPIKTYDKEFDLRTGGVEAKLMHFGSAYTDGDTVVYFPLLKVVAVGDLFSGTPNPDFSAGGSLVGWGPVLAQILKLDFDVVVPGTGPTVGRADLEAFKTKIDTLVSRAAGLVKDGVPKDQLMGKLKTDDLGWQLSFTPEQIDHFYSELSQAERGQLEVSGADAQQALSQPSGWQSTDVRQSSPTTAVNQ